MILGKVLGRVVLSAMEPGLKNMKLIIVQPVNEKQEPAGKPLIAIDMIGSGSGELILMVKGKESVATLPEPHPPADYGINAIVDDIYYVKERR